jgi:acyl-coenzyme A thioesterase 13
MGNLSNTLTLCSLSNVLVVDLGGSLAVASRGLFATGVSTDLSVTYLNSGGKIGDTIKAVVTCDKCK